MRAFVFILGLVPVVMLAQSPELARAGEAPNATTKAVLMADRPTHFTEEQWLKMMERPANRALYPLRLDQAMLDTLDTKALDLRFLYELAPAR